MNIGIVIQARLSSQRLAKKVVLPIFENKSILDIIIIRLKKIIPNLPIIIATGDLQKNRLLNSYASKHGVFFFSGSEDDVLKRFIECARQYNLQKILRVCADNPFLDYQLSQKLIDISLDDSYDYVGYSVNQKPAILSHYGFFSEVVTYDALVKAHSLSDKSSDREHVTPYIYNHPEEFSIKLEAAPQEIINEPNVRLTVDTEIDFENSGKILQTLSVDEGDFSYTYKDVLSAAKSMGNSLEESMAEQIVLNSKS